MIDQVIEGEFLHNHTCDICLDIPNTMYRLHPHNVVKLGKFSTTLWIVMYGWYSYGGNRDLCGWYLICKDDPSVIKPLSRPDLDDIVLIEV